MLVVARKVADLGSLPAPQQSDYAQHEWLNPGRSGAVPAGRGGTARAIDALGLLDAARRARETLRAVATSGMALPAPDYERVVVADLLRRGGRR